MYMLKDFLFHKKLFRLLLLNKNYVSLVMYGFEYKENLKKS